MSVPWSILTVPLSAPVILLPSVPCPLSLTRRPFLDRSGLPLRGVSDLQVKEEVLKCVDREESREEVKESGLVYVCEPAVLVQGELPDTPTS